ncbi:MAG TPA: GNAT family N-acetyltransferase [Rhodospirillaceae bacterium]|nr:GNAT family N-acetyltransferase [Rhodospirillaceae bacterium]
MLRLILPDTRYLASYIAALREGFRIGVRDIPPEEEIQKIEKDPFDHLEGINRQGGFFTPPDGIERKRVPFNDYWLVDDKDFIGAISLRYELNDFLETHGGHIGYGIRPSMMRKGYAKAILTLGLQKMRARGITSIFITCDEDNVASWKTIESKGGIIMDKAPSIFCGGSIRRRYLIEIKD